MLWWRNMVFFEACSTGNSAFAVCKTLLGVKKSTQNDFIFRELGRISLQTNVFCTVINYWLKILETEQTMYVRYAYQLMLSDLEKRPNVSNWASKLKDLLSNLGFYDVWLNPGVANKNAFLRIIKERSNDNFIQNWNRRLSESSRASFYTLFFLV